jgi:phosphonate transport system substrate-binding protein
MRAWGIRVSLVVIVILLMHALPARTNRAESPVRFAVLPCSNIEITLKKFYPLLAYLKKETGLEVKLVVPSDFEGYAASVRGGRVEFALQDPHTYLELAPFFDRTRLLKTLTLEGKSTQSGVVVVRRDSSIGRLEDLRGKTVLFGPKTSTPKWVGARTLFAANGIDIDRDLKTYRNGGCCEDIAFSVFMKSVDAGVICEHFLTDHQEKQKDLGVDAGKLMVIARTGSFPTRVFAARSGMAGQITEKFTRALLKLTLENPDHAKILYRGEIGGFRPGNHAEYEGLRRSSNRTGLE